MQHYFDLIISKDGVLVAYREKSEVIEREIDLCGYFVIVTSEDMTTKEAVELYKSRDTSEKLFSSDKSFLGNKRFRTYSIESTSAKIFIEFIALIIRCKMYTCLKDESERLETKPNYMTVPAAIKELEKIEMIRGFDNVYRLDHAITATQETILGHLTLMRMTLKEQSDAIAKEIEELIKEKEALRKRRINKRD